MRFLAELHARSGASSQWQWMRILDRAWSQGMPASLVDVLPTTAKLLSGAPDLPLEDRQLACNPDLRGALWHNLAAAAARLHGVLEAESVDTLKGAYLSLSLALSPFFVLRTSWCAH